ncbi:ABC transporter substrate-binding protein [Kribbella endophytica]
MTLTPQSWSAAARTRSRMLLTAGLVVATMVACSSSPGPQQAAEQIKGTDAPITNLTWAVPTAITSLDYLHGAAAMQNLMEGLVGTDGKGRLVPALAASWKQSSPTAYVFTLREGVKFWDGAPLTADDVVWSLDFARTPASEPVFSGQLAGIRSVAANGPGQVTVTLKAPDSAFLAKLTPAMIVQKKFSQAAGARLGSPEIGVMATGPFTLKSLAPTGETVIVRNDAYWGEKATVRQVTYRTIADPDTLRLALESGDVDGSFSYPLTGPVSSTFHTTYAPGPHTTYLILDTTTAPFNDVHARRALAYLVDRPGIAKALFNDHATPSNTVALPSLYVDVAPDEQVRTFFDVVPELSLDVEKAKAELAQSATPNGFSLQVNVPPPVVAPLQQIMETIAQNAKPLGIDLQVKPGTFASWQQAVVGKADKLVGMTAGSAYVAPAGQFEQLVSKTGPKATDGTFGLWAPADVRKLMTEASGAKPDRLWAISQEIITKMSAEMPYVPIVTPALPLALNRKYVFDGGFQPYSSVFASWAVRIRATA